MEEARELAPEWRSWLLEKSREYQEVKVELDPRGIVVDMTKGAIAEITAGRGISHAQFQLEEVREKAESFEKQLEEMKLKIRVRSAWS